MAVIGILLLLVVVPSRTARPRHVPSTRIAATRQTAALTFAQELAVTGVSEAAIYGPTLAPNRRARRRGEGPRGVWEGRRARSARLIGESGVLRARPDGLPRRLVHGPRRLGVGVDGRSGRRIEARADRPVARADARSGLDTAGWRVTDGSGGGGPSPRTPLSLLADGGSDVQGASACSVTRSCSSSWPPFGRSTRPGERRRGAGAGRRRQVQDGERAKDDDGCKSTAIVCAGKGVARRQPDRCRRRGSRRDRRRWRRRP